MLKKMGKTNETLEAMRDVANFRLCNHVFYYVFFFKECLKDRACVNKVKMNSYRSNK